MMDPLRKNLFHRLAKLTGLPAKRIALSARRMTTSEILPHVLRLTYPHGVPE